MKSEAVDEYDFVAENATTARNVMLGYMALGMVQVAIIINGADLWAATRLVSAAELALFFTCVPLAATIMVMFRAVALWHWSLLRASAVFLGPYVVLLVVVASTGVDRLG